MDANGVPLGYRTLRRVKTSLSPREKEKRGIVRSKLITEKDENSRGKITKSVLLTDILGAEDHFGDMDFKI